MILPINTNTIIKINYNKKLFTFNFKYVKHEDEILRFFMNYKGQMYFLCINYEEFKNYIIESINEKYNVNEDQINNLFNDLLENLDYYGHYYNLSMYNNMKPLFYKITNAIIKYKNIEMKSKENVKNKFKNKIYIMLNNEIWHTKDMDNIYRFLYIFLDCFDNSNITVLNNKINEINYSTFTIYDFIFDL